MTDPEHGLTEADVTINGQALSFAESMVLRCAVSEMRMGMNAPAAKQALGQLADHYDYHLRKIEALIMRTFA